MYRPPSGHMSQPPTPVRSRPAQQALSIRTAISPATSPPMQQGLSSPPQQTQPYPTYPIPVPPAKLAKAVKLYTRYRLEEGLAQRVQQPGQSYGGSLLSPVTAQSITSRTSSRRYTPSVSTSTYDGVTDLSSLVSFNGEESPSSATAHASTELTTFDGKKIKQRTRKPLSPTAKAKAALIRYLESCWVCRSRRVPCPLEHHDINSLERARQSRSHRQRERPQVQPHQSHSSVSTSSHRASGSLSAGQPASSGGSMGQTNSLLGLGQNEQLLQTFSTPTIDPQSPAADPLVGIEAQGSTPSFTNVIDTIDVSSLLDPNPYASYQDRQMFALGVHRERFICQHLEALCAGRFQTQEELETHFENTHFAFTRIKPAHRYICSHCQTWNTQATGSCSGCGINGSIEIWIYGNFIRTPSFQRYSPDGQDLFKREVTSSAPYFSSSYTFTNTDPFGPGLGDAGSFNGGTNQGGYPYHNNGSFGNPSSQGYNHGAFNTPGSGSYLGQGNGSVRGRQRVHSSSLFFRHCLMKAAQKYRCYKFVLLTMALLVMVSILVETLDWLIMKGRAVHFRSNLPVIGFVSVLVSFALCYKYWSVKHMGPLRGPRRAQCRPRRCPLHVLPTFSLDCRQSGPGIYARSGL